MSVNNFKELEKMELAELGKPPEAIKQNVSQNMNVFRAIGDLIVLYLPHFGRSLINMSGGNKKNPPSKYPNQN